MPGKEARRGATGAGELLADGSSAAYLKDTAVKFIGGVANKLMLAAEGFKGEGDKKDEGGKREAEPDPLLDMQVQVKTFEDLDMLVRSCPLATAAPALADG
jgi:hypothetical protein